MSMNAEWEKFFHVFREYTVTLRHGPENVEQVTVEQLYKAFSERYVAEAIGRWAREGEWDEPLPNSPQVGFVLRKRPVLKP